MKKTQPSAFTMAGAATAGRARQAETPPRHGRVRAPWRRIHGWWLARTPRVNPVILRQRAIYLLPTRAGLLLTLTLAVLLVASINYQLNLGYLLTFLLAGCTAAGVFVGHATLRGLALHLQPVAPVFAGQAAALHITLGNTRRQPRIAVGLRVAAQRDTAWVDVPPQAEVTVTLALPCPVRGWRELPRLLAETRFPIGAFHIWAHWRPAVRVLVYPRPEVAPPPLPFDAAGATTRAAQRAPTSETPDTLRAYRSGDPPRMIAWKKFAQIGVPVSRAGTRTQGATLWLDLAAAGRGNREAAVARLTAWVLAADAAHCTYGLRLGAQTMPPANGPAHRQRCLQALALC